jgi:hypothetical protein
MTVSLECLMQCEDVSVAFSLEASKVKVDVKLKNM